MYYYKHDNCNLIGGEPYNYFITCTVHTEFKMAVE